MGEPQQSFEVVRVFEAPRERVWDEWTRPEAFADWFGGLEIEIPLRSVTMDVRPGGGLRATMLAGTREIHWAGEYLEVDPPRRLHFTLTDRPGEPDRALITVELEDLGGGRTEMRFEQRGQMPPQQIRAARGGWGKFFDRLAARLA